MMMVAGSSHESRIAAIRSGPLVHDFPNLVPGGHRGRESGQPKLALTQATELPILPAMNGLLQICGICREIIR